MEIIEESETGTIHYLNVDKKRENIMLPKRFEKLAAPKILGIRRCLQPLRTRLRAKSMRSAFFSNTVVVSFMALASCNGMEDCEKDYHFKGNVKDNVSNPLGGVEVFLYAPETGNDSGLVAATDSTGSYESRGISRASQVGAQVKFVKTGYGTVLSSVITSDEGGASNCGYRQIVRDAVMTP